MTTPTTPSSAPVLCTWPACGARARYIVYGESGKAEYCTCSCSDHIGYVIPELNYHPAVVKGWIVSPVEEDFTVGQLAGMVARLGTSTSPTLRSIPAPPPPAGHPNPTPEFLNIIPTVADGADVLEVVDDLRKRVAALEQAALANTTWGKVEVPPPFLPSVGFTAPVCGLKERVPPGPTFTHSVREYIPGLSLVVHHPAFTEDVAGTTSWPAMVKSNPSQSEGDPPGEATRTTSKTLVALEVLERFRWEMVSGKTTAPLLELLHKVVAKSIERIVEVRATQVVVSPPTSGSGHYPADPSGGLVD